MNAKIDCKKEIIKYDLTNNHDISNYELKKIKSVEDTVIPELSIRLIKASIESEDGEYVIEENNRMIQTNGLRLARSLLTVTDRKTHIWITNPYPRPLKIMKDQTLAHGSLPAEVVFIEKLEQINNDEIQFQINKNLSPKEQEDLKQILIKYADLFSPRLGRTNLAKHWIDTEDAKPIKHKPYRVSPKERDIIKDQIDEMLKEGIIRPSSSPWSFPVILVKKRDGKFRFCVDYRKLNEVTVKDVYPIPRIDDVMDTLQGSKYFSAIDLRSGYWQVEIEEKDKEKTAFTTTHGLYEFNVMPFGLCNAPATFERNMDNVLGNLRWQICLCYLDDVIIYSSDFPTHLKRLEAVLKCFSGSNLKLNDKKCRFAFEELEILGHITNQQGIKPAEYNIKAVRDFPLPKKVKEVQSFLGMCSYYRKCIKYFSLIADPLTGLIRKNSQFTWTENQEEAFQNLKKVLINPPILGHFDPNAATYIHTDASNIGLGATLVQIICREEKVISYLSRTLSKSEQNYSTTEKECLAVVWAISKLRPYLYGRHFKIITDHHALCWLKILKIQQVDLQGPLPETDWVGDYERLFLNQIINEEDEFIENVEKSLKESKRAITQNFKEENGCLYKKNPNPEGRAWLLVVPKKRRKEIMSEFHNHMLNGHLGVARTTYRLKNKYHWPSMLKDVSEFVKTCHLCQSRKGSNHLPSGLLQPIPPANYPFERIGIDFVGPLPSTKRRRKWIIVLTDYYTRYAETKAVSEATVKEVSTFLIEQFFLRHGAPRFLISDRGSQFTSNLMKEIMKMCKVKHCFTTSYHPQTNGLTERLNRTLINMISMYVNTDQKNWDEILPFVTHAYNTTIQETTGYSPFFLLFGREPMSLLDDDNIPINDYDEYIENYLDKIARTRQVVINNTEKTQERMKINYDKKHNERIYEPGHLVAVWTPVRKIGKFVIEAEWKAWECPYTKNEDTVALRKFREQIKVELGAKDRDRRVLTDYMVDKVNLGYNRRGLTQMVKVPGMTTNGVLLSNEMASQTITFCSGSAWGLKKDGTWKRGGFKRAHGVRSRLRKWRKHHFTKIKENTLGRTQEVALSQEDATPPPAVSDVLVSLTRTLHQLSAVTGLSRDVDLPRYDGSYEAKGFFDNYDAQADLAQLQHSTRLRKPPNLLQAPLRVTNTRAYPWAFPSKSTSTLTYIRTLKKVLQQGSSKRLLSDRAPAFTSEKFRKFLLSRGIQPLLTTSNNPQANGLIERLNDTITGKLRLLYLENPKTSLTKLIKQVVQIYNQSPHTITGFPPIFLMFNSIPPELPSAEHSLSMKGTNKDMMKVIKSRF
ncbi:hypothetical protein LAZ67_4002457 [Cordylochernes scorpioides]|uniref:RNA-directed DNA polymerase n=1 Tax=Cordylochernes scorpioides TaxID=51811 RepID=A0ABY6KCT1_9ARAC|nr:hypothetical protein LAZ67_4002457 [Cordylochernes scorpioides]